MRGGAPFVPFHHEQHLDNLRRKDSLRGAETTEISAHPGNYSASHFEGSAKGHLGAVVQLGMTVMAYNGAVVVRIWQQCLSKRVHKFRRLLRLRSRKINEINNPKN